MSHVSQQTPWTSEKSIYFFIFFAALNLHKALKTLEISPSFRQGRECIADDRVEVAKELQVRQEVQTKCSGEKLRKAQGLNLLVSFTKVQLKLMMRRCSAVTFHSSNVRKINGAYNCVRSSFRLKLAVVTSLICVLTISES